MQTFFIYTCYGKGPIPDNFVRQWRAFYPHDILKDVTDRQKTLDHQGVSVRRYDHLFTLQHEGGLETAVVKKSNVLEAMRVLHILETGVARNVDLMDEEIAAQTSPVIIELSKNVFGPSSAEKPRTYERGGVRHIG